MFGCWQEDGGSVLPTRFMATAEQRHAVPKLSRSALEVFVYWVKQVYAGDSAFLPICDEYHENGRVATLA